MSTPTNTLESLSSRFAKTFTAGDKLDLERAKLAYAACSAITDGGLGISTRDFADAVGDAAGRGFKDSTISRLVQAYRLPFSAGTVPTATVIGLALSLLNNGRKVGDTFKAIAASVLEGPSEGRPAALESALSQAVNDMRAANAAKRTGNIDRVADKVAEMLAPSPVGGDSEASDRGIAPVPASVDVLLASVNELTLQITSGQIVPDHAVWAAFDALSDAMASVPALV